MTRDQIKEKIKEIILGEVYTDYTRVLQGHDEAADEIMKLWDQGFTYELDKPKNS